MTKRSELSAAVANTSNPAPNRASVVQTISQTRRDQRNVGTRRRYRLAVGMAIGAATSLGSRHYRARDLALHATGSQRP
jgi:hypothetical protein